MSRQLVFSSTISVMVMAAFALSAPIKAQDAAQRPASVQVGTVGGR